MSICLLPVFVFITESSLGVFTVEDVVEGVGFGWFQFAITMFAGATWVRRSCDSHKFLYAVRTQTISMN